MKLEDVKIGMKVKLKVTLSDELKNGDIVKVFALDESYRFNVCVETKKCSRFWVRNEQIEPLIEEVQLQEQPRFVNDYSMMVTGEQLGDSSCVMELTPKTISIVFKGLDGELLYDYLGDNIHTALYGLHKAFISYYLPRNKEPVVRFVDAMYILEHVDRIRCRVETMLDMWAIKENCNVMEKGFAELKK